MSRTRHLKTAAEIWAEYERLLDTHLVSSARYYEQGAAIHCLKWVLGIESESPADSLVPKPGQDDYKP